MKYHCCQRRYTNNCKFIFTTASCTRAVRPCIHWNCIRNFSLFRRILCYGRKGNEQLLRGHASATQTTKQPQQAGPLNTAFTEGQLCPSLWWYLLHCALIAACALILYVTYDNFSPYVSLWADFSGTAVWVAPKSVQAVALPIVVQIMITLICFIIAVRIKNAPLRLKGVNAQAELNRSRKRRAVWSAFLCVLAFIADLTLYAYMHFMFLIPQYKAYVPVIIYAALLLTLALTLFWLTDPRKISSA